MTITVLRRGDSIFPIEITCLHCGSVLRIEKPADLILGGDQSHRAPYFICPVCKKQSALHEADREQALLEYSKQK